MVLIWGEKDVHGSLSATTEMVLNMPNASVKLIEDVGHLPWLEAPQESAGALIKFINGQKHEL